MLQWHYERIAICDISAQNRRLPKSAKGVQGECEASVKQVRVWSKCECEQYFSRTNTELHFLLHLHGNSLLLVIYISVRKKGFSMEVQQANIQHFFKPFHQISESIWWIPAKFMYNFSNRICKNIFIFPVCKVTYL